MEITGLSTIAEEPVDGHRMDMGVMRYVLQPVARFTHPVLWAHHWPLFESTIACHCLPLPAIGSHGTYLLSRSRLNLMAKRPGGGKSGPGDS